MPRPLLLFTATITLLTSLGFGWYSLALPAHPTSSELNLFSVSQGQGNKEIALNLEEQGYIRFPNVFRFWALLTGVSGRLQAGEYQLSHSMSPLDILEAFVKGEVVKETVTVREGWSTREIAKALEEHEIASKEEFFTLAGFPAVDYRVGKDLPAPKDFSSEFPFLASKPSSLGLEGYLFPDTYEVKRGESLEMLVRRMLTRFDKKFDTELRAEAATQGKTVFEIVTMASLLEKEVRTHEDKQVVSGILWKRLDAGMPLQVDATVVYAKEDIGSRVLIADTKVDSPFNTYANRGLPLGPISNPGIESIQAALYPRESPYWFYLSAKDGTTIFSRTFEQHKQAKAIYLR